MAKVSGLSHDRFSPGLQLAPSLAHCALAHPSRPIHPMPGGNRLPPRPLVAINQEYATLQSELHGGEEVAVIPPVAGG